MVNLQGLSCGSCAWPMGPETWNQPGGAVCPRCSSRVDVTVFPAALRGESGVLPEQVQAEAESSCFYHATNRAVTPCEECGRFLCRLCEIPVDARILCPVCFATGATGNKLHEFDRKRTMFDTIALALATFPGIFVWTVVLTGPAALYFAIRYWRAPSSVVPRTRVRYYLAILFALAELTGLGFVIWGFMQLPLSNRS
jgi:hypothetical protein